ncbi:hypothetical protein CC78DRAFT_612964 [Lojkania enalia]|uniref:Uncharacterized protein n=1 Tax=Lojkania enalia TaxID=147567 RepID=A0A9P4KH53_9PLEO|nr:hypothetical protein CC78DRAFT_612964 [Didymosphaeria enalia]
MNPLPTSASAEKAQAAANHGLEQWSAFYRITKDEARYIRSRYPGKTWPEIPANEKMGVLDRVNEQLSQQNIPVVREDVLRWRMLQIMREMKRQYLESVGLNSPSPDTSPDSRSHWNIVLQ